MLHLRNKPRTLKLFDVSNNTVAYILYYLS